MTIPNEILNKINLAYENIHRHRNLSDLNEFSITQIEPTFVFMKVTDDSGVITQQYYKNNFSDVPCTITKNSGIYHIQFPEIVSFEYSFEVIPTNKYKVSMSFVEQTTTYIDVKATDLSTLLGVDNIPPSAEFYLKLERL